MLSMLATSRRPNVSLARTPRSLLRVAVRSFRPAGRTAICPPAPESKGCPTDQQRANAVREQPHRRGSPSSRVREEPSHVGPPAELGGERVVLEVHVAPVEICVRVVVNIERGVTLRADLEVRAAPLVAHADPQLIGSRVPIERHLDTA